MHRKIFISFLLIALINFLLGCYSAESITVLEYKQVEEEDKPDDIRVITKDSQEYHFSESNFYVEDDTLYGKVDISEQLLDRKIALSDIESIQFEYLNGGTTALLVLGIVVISFVVLATVFVLSGGVGYRGK